MVNDSVSGPYPLIRNSRVEETYSLGFLTTEKLHPISCACVTCMCHKMQNPSHGTDASCTQTLVSCPALPMKREHIAAAAANAAASAPANAAAAAAAHATAAPAAAPAAAAAAAATAAAATAMLLGIIPQLLCCWAYFNKCFGLKLFHPLMAGLKTR